MSNDLTAMSATELAAQIRSGATSAREVMQAYLERIQAKNSVISAIVTLDPARSLEEAARCDRARAAGQAAGSLAGVPFTVKDALETADMPTSCGSPRLRDHRPAADAPAVARLRAQGAILLGKTNLPTLTGDYQSSNPLFGTTKNPWDLSRTPGGSSGGGAAAVAARISPIDLGSDMGGSVRLPAHYSGVIGFKPTAHRVPLAGHIPPWPGRPRGLRHFSTVGLLARSLADVEVALHAIAGPATGEWLIPPVPLADAQPRPLRSLKVAYSNGFAGMPLAAELAAAMEALVAKLEAAGAEVKECAPSEFDPFRAAELYGTIYAAEIGSTEPAESQQAMAAKLRDAGMHASSEPYSRGYVRGLDASTQVYMQALADRDRMIAAVEQHVHTWDVWLCPVAPTAAIVRTKERTVIRVDDRDWPYMAQGWFCLPFSLTHHPAIALPAGLTSGGLPYAIQLVGRLWADIELLRMAAAIAEVIEPLPAPVIPSQAPPAQA